MATSIELTSTGDLRCTVTSEDADLPPDVSERIRQAFTVSTAQGLLHLATAEMGTALPPALSWWREFACRFLSQLCRSPLAAPHSADKRQMKALLRKTKQLHLLIALSKGGSHIYHIPLSKMGSHNILPGSLDPSKAREHEEAMKEVNKYYIDSTESAWEGVTKRYNVMNPPMDGLASALQSAPTVTGFEHLSVEVLQELWESLSGHIWKEAGWAPRQWIQKQNRLWQRVGKLVIHLSENLASPEHPFFFRVDYVAALTGRGGMVFMNDPSFEEWLSSKGQVHWVSANLKNALADFVDKLNSEAKKSGGLSSFTDIVMNCIQGTDDGDEIQLGRAGAKGSYHLGRNHPWTAEQAFRLLLGVSRLEARGFELVVPEWWIAGQSRRLQALVTVGDQKTQKLGMKALLDFSVKLTIGDEELSEEELRAVLASSAGLIRLKEKWVAVDQERLKALLDRWEALRQGDFANGIPLFQAMRLLSGFDLENGPPLAEDDIGERTRVVPGAWLEKTLVGMRDPAKLQDRPADPDLLATLRPYQETGVGWLWFMSNLSLGACLADDMGLGKTIQVLALLLRLKRETREADPEAVPPLHLLVVPASLIGNWKEEVGRHAPSISVVCVHPSELSAVDQEAIAADPASRLLGLLGFTLI